jgi:hypothetical protein
MSHTKGAPHSPGSIDCLCAVLLGTAQSTAGCKSRNLPAKRPLAGSSSPPNAGLTENPVLREVAVSAERPRVRIADYTLIGVPRT